MVTGYVVRVSLAGPSETMETLGFCFFVAAVREVTEAVRRGNFIIIEPKEEGYVSKLRPTKVCRCQVSLASYGEKSRPRRAAVWQRRGFREQGS